MWDGMDILAAREATRFALDYCPKNGPLVYEISTYRYHGHLCLILVQATGPVMKVQEMRQTRDPITGSEIGLLALDLLKSELKAIEGQVRKDVDADMKSQG